MSNSLFMTKDFNNPLMKETPKDWEILQVQNFAKVIRGASPRPKDDPRFYGGPIPRLMGEDVTRDSKWVTPRVDSLTIEGAKLSRPLKKGDFVIVCSGTVGIPCLLAVDACIHDGFIGLVNIDESKVSKDYLYLWFSSVRNKMDAAATHGGVFTNLTTRIIKDSFVSLPPVVEQQKIAEIIETIDKAIALTDTHITKLKKAKAGLLHDLLTRGIDDRGELRDYTRNPELFKRSPLGIIPKDWDVVQLESVCERITDGSHQSVTTSDTGIPFLYVSCVREGQILWEQAAKISESLYTEISRGKEPKAGLILYTAVGSYGHAALVKDNRKFSFQRHIAYILPSPEKIVPGYLCLWLNSPNCKNYADQVALGNAQKTVTLGVLSNFPVAISHTLKEQKIIVEHFDVYDKKIGNKEIRLEKLKLLKKGLMSDLLTGRVRVKI